MPPIGFTMMKFPMIIEKKMGTDNTLQWKIIFNPNNNATMKALYDQDQNFIGNELDITYSHLEYPYTGGRGSLIYLFSGLLLMLLSITLYKRNNRAKDIQQN